MLELITLGVITLLALFVFFSIRDTERLIEDAKVKREKRHGLKEEEDKIR